MLVRGRQHGLDRIKQRGLARTRFAGEQHRVGEDPFAVFQRAPMPGEQLGDFHASPTRGNAGLPEAASSPAGDGCAAAGWGTFRPTSRNASSMASSLTKLI